MTPGQERAVRELERLRAANPDAFGFTMASGTVQGLLVAEISLRLGPMEKRPGGLDLREREDFLLCIYPDFPFQKPALLVSHDRFAGFPHVIWSRTLCLYQSNLEWNPADGLFGYFDRLKLWLGKAALNDMDPQEGPLEPPHHVTDFSKLPFVIRSDAPVAAGEIWYGFAELSKHPNRIELIGWNDLTRELQPGTIPALAIALPKALPMEFPEKGKTFFAELSKQGVDKERVLRDLQIAASLTPPNESAYLILLMPMRRSHEGELKHHVAVWSIDPKNAQHLRDGAPESTDWTRIKEIKHEINQLTYEIFELSTLTWCQVLEDRPEIIVRRDIETPMARFAGKKILVLGCGALGSWLGEMLARANCQSIHLVDTGLVKPGLLVRQNYVLEDIGARKVMALAERLRKASKTSIEPFHQEAHQFIFSNPDRFNAYDVVFDCTASSIFQMKLERDWQTLNGRTPPILSVIIDANARHCLCISLSRGATGGIWDGYVRFKYGLSGSGKLTQLTDAFYGHDATRGLFQPEPGCSDPTFSGSSTDICGLISTALNSYSENAVSPKQAEGLAFSAVASGVEAKKPFRTDLDAFEEYAAGNYRLRVSSKVFREARAWVRNNSRVRAKEYETGGLLWGYWDDSVGVIWIFDASGPPPDSKHSPGHFVCGVLGTADEHKFRMQRSKGSSGFVGFWHTHPEMVSEQSGIDIYGMGKLVSTVGENQKRSIMLIFGRTGGTGTVGIYVYESRYVSKAAELLSVGATQVALKTAVV